LHICQFVCITCQLFSVSSCALLVNSSLSVLMHYLSSSPDNYLSIGQLFLFSLVCIEMLFYCCQLDVSYTRTRHLSINLSATECLIIIIISIISCPWYLIPEGFCCWKVQKQCLKSLKWREVWTVTFYKRLMQQDGIVTLYTQRQSLP